MAGSGARCQFSWAHHEAAGQGRAVTAGSGIGRQLTPELLRRGARIAAQDLSAATLEETRRLAAADGAFEAFTVDVADRALAQRLPAAVQVRLGAVDGLVTCAGIIQPFVDIAALDDAVIERVFDVNRRGTLLLTRAFLPVLLARPAAHVVNVSSMGGFLPVPGQSVYGASKAAVKLFTEGLHAELAGTAVRVTAVFPGAVATNFSAPSCRCPRAPWADRAAREILDGLERDAYRVLIGADAKALDAPYRIVPRRAAGFIGRKMNAVPG